jgi:hypothetical protein
MNECLTRSNRYFEDFPAFRGQVTRDRDDGAKMGWYPGWTKVRLIRKSRKAIRLSSEVPRTFRLPTAYIMYESNQEAIRSLARS